MLNMIVNSAWNLAEEMSKDSRCEPRYVLGIQWIRDDIQMILDDNIKI